MSEDLIRRSDVLGYISRLNGCGLGKVKTLEYIRKYVERLPSADRPQKVIAQVTFDEEKLREIVKEAVERFKEEYEITDRPQGEWVSDYSSPVAYRCTACNTLQHWSVIQNGRYRFCPNCGARMKGVSTDIDCFDTCKHAYSEVCDECYKGNKYNAVKGADDE